MLKKIYPYCIIKVLYMYTGRKDIVQTLFIIIFMNKNERKRVGVKYYEGQKGIQNREKTIFTETSYHKR